MGCSLGCFLRPVSDWLYAGHNFGFDQTKSDSSYVFVKIHSEWMFVCESPWMCCFMSNLSNGTQLMKKKWQSDLTYSEDILCEHNRLVQNDGQIINKIKKVACFTYKWLIVLVANARHYLEIILVLQQLRRWWKIKMFLSL